MLHRPKKLTPHLFMFEPHQITLLRETARANGCSMSILVREALDQYFAKKKVTV